MEPEKLLITCTMIIQKYEDVSDFPKRDPCLGETNIWIDKLDLAEKPWISNLLKKEYGLYRLCTACNWKFSKEN